MPIIDWWKRLHDHYKGDPAKITLFTIVILILSDMPMYFFTILDMLKLKALYKYRLHYASEVSGHLGNRVYPPLDVLKEAAKTTEFNFLFAYVIPGYIGIKLANKLKIFIYDTEREINYWRLFKEIALISVFADLCFYGVHRFVHLPQFYQFFHKKHHEFKYTIALAHHYMTYHEALLMALPQALPPVLLWPIFGRMHILSMWGGIFFTQFGAILGHAGYHFINLPDWFPFFRPAYHDLHHIDYKVNFAASFEFTDALFGTLVRAPLATAKDIAHRAGVEKAYDYARQAISHH